MKKKIVASLMAVTVAGTLLTACGSGSGNANTVNAASDSAETSGEVKHVLIGTGGSARPYIYTDDDNNLIGYEADLIYAIDEYLEDYKFEFEKTDFSSMFLGIDSGKYQMGANNITKKPEREEKYLFADEYDMYNFTVAIVAADNDDIHSLDDLAGKKMYVSGGGGFGQLFAETFNETHADNPIEMEYSDADQLKVYQDISNGVIDFSLTEIVMFESYLEEYPELKETLKYVEFTTEETNQIQDPYGWFVYPKTAEGEEIKAAVDEALRALKADGTVTEIAERNLGYDTVGR